MIRTRNYLSNWILTTVGVVIAVVMAQSAMAQETIGGIHGVVKDPSGAMIPGAEVQASSPALVGHTRKVSTDSAGYYRFLFLPPGEYTVEVTATGFRKQAHTGIRLDVGRLLPVDLQMEVGPVTQTVEVQATAIIVDTTQSKVSVNVTSEAIATIPKGRSFADLITFAPGARYEPLQSDLTATTNPGAYPGYQIDGASDSENVYALEGLDTSAVYGGGVGQNIPLDFVQELNIKSSGFEAEYGGALGGVVNVVTKKGANNWHGSGLLYYRSNTFTGAPRPDLRANPEDTIDEDARLSERPEYYYPKDDSWRVMEPGGDLGGYIKKDMLWFYGSYIPRYERRNRTVHFTDIGSRIFPRTDRTYNALGRLDFSPVQSIRTAFNWSYAYNRWEGNLPTRDSRLGQYNFASDTNPDTYSAKRGQVAPNKAYIGSAYFTISPKMLASVRFGYWLTDLQDRGTPSGIRYRYRTSSLGLVGLDGTPVPDQFQKSTGFQTMPDNSSNVFDLTTRTGLSADWSYFVRGGGAHTLKAGYAMNRLHNGVFYGYNTAYVNFYWNRSFPTAGAPLLPMGEEVCAQLEAANGACRGNYGVYRVIDFSTVGNVASFNHSIYAQDAWSVGKRLTLNLGVRFDKEELPSFLSGGTMVSVPIKFGFFDKVAPRLGAAVDVLGNGKLKVFGSWGMYYDIMKYALPRGSFGGDYWHDCWFTIDNPDFTSVVPALANNHSCPGGGGLPGTKIEEVDWRITANDTSFINPDSIANDVTGRIQNNLKPMRLRRMDLGSEYALLPDLGLEVRWTRNRLDYTIEDAGILGPMGEGYYIVNPGYGITKLMLADECPTCPPMPKAVRNYDGVEFRLNKRYARNWFANVSYTYSRLWGNYSGLTSTEIGDAGGGRHDPNVSRYFDLVPEAFDAHGRPTSGFLPTDRPHTVKIYSSYTLKWAHMESIFGLSQWIYSGVPWTTEINVISSTPVHPEGIGAWVPLTRDSSGNFVSGGVQQDHRGPAYTNTDFLFSHDIKLSRTNEALRLTFEMNVSNLFNKKSTLRYFTNPVYAGDTISMSNEEFFQGFDYVSALNDQGLIFENRYGMGDVFTLPRQLRFKVKFNF